MARLSDTSVTSIKEPDFFSLQVREAQRFYLDLAPPPEEPIAVVCGGYEQCATDYAIHRTSFPYYTIEFVVRGKGSMTLDGKDYPLTVGSVFPTVRVLHTTSPLMPPIH